MTTDDIAKKYQIHTYTFEMFLRQNKLEFVRIAGYIFVDDKNVPQYVDMYKKQYGNVL